MRFVEVVDGLFRATRRGINLYLWMRPGETVLFDTGEPGFAEGIVAAVRPFPPVRTIFLTHCHFDHAGSAAQLARTFGADVHAHPADAELLRLGKWRRPSTPSPSLVGRAMTKFVASRYPDRLDPIEGILSITPGADFPFPEMQLIALPGHAAGQIGFGLTLPGDTRVWVVGDVVMTIGGMREPILYEDRSLGLASIQKLAGLLKPGDVICPGHGKPRTANRTVIQKLHRLGQRRS
ncbi:MAG: MBL fold metallo-hydrolase [Pseudomonadota bacterium]